MCDQFNYASMLGANNDLLYVGYKPSFLMYMVFIAPLSTLEPVVYLTQLFIRTFSLYYSFYLYTLFYPFSFW